MLSAKTTLSRKKINSETMVKQKCPYCNDNKWGNRTWFEQHMKICKYYKKGCKFYSEIFSITPFGLKCKLCSSKTNFKAGNIHEHIREIHFNEFQVKNRWFEHENKEVNSISRKKEKLHNKIDTKGNIECGLCNENISLCIYIRKSGKKYQCVICQIKVLKLSVMYNHLKRLG